MKNIVRTFAVALLAPTALAAGTIKNSKHDLSSASTTTGAKASSETEICKFCHTPHKGTSGGAIPLLNRAATTSATFGTYTATQAGTPLPTSISGVSAVCMGCHDGATALGAVTNAGGGTSGTIVMGATNTTAGGAMATTAPAYLGTNLSTSHPAGIPYAGQTVGTQVSKAVVADYTTVGAGGVVSNTNGSVALHGTTGAYSVECSTCHDVHNGGPAGASYLLVVNNTGSALCLTCHVK